MNIERAIFSILGDEAGHAIIADMGLHWAVVAAMAQATTADDPTALATIRHWGDGSTPCNVELKASPAREGDLCPVLHLTGGTHKPGYVDPSTCGYCGIGMRR